MKAIVQTRYGSPDVLQVRDVAEPVVGDDQVLLIRALSQTWDDGPNGLRV